MLKRKGNKIENIREKEDIVDGKENYFPLNCLIKKEERISIYFHSFDIRDKTEDIENILNSKLLKYRHFILSLFPILKQN